MFGSWSVESLEPLLKAWSGIPDMEPGLLLRDDMELKGPVRPHCQRNEQAKRCI